MLEHGGAVVQAAHKYAIPIDQWLDLSTGHNPAGWPIPEIPETAFRNLPESDDKLELAARQYYGNELVLATAGTQAAIKTLPSLRSLSKVGAISPSYAEHPYAWEQHGHRIIQLDHDEIAHSARYLNTIILANPNNPTGLIWYPEQLLQLLRDLAERDGWLIVDETFIDATPELSLVSEVGQPGLIVLRSLGKFFGLSGVRLGFTLAWPELLLRLKEKLGPWCVNGPARFIGAQALVDKPWQDQARQSLKQQSNRLRELLQNFGLSPNGSTSFFHWVVIDKARELHEFLARVGILTRLFVTPLSIRFGLPESEMDWSRLTEALRLYKNNLVGHKCRSESKAPLAK